MRSGTRRAGRGARHAWTAVAAGAALAVPVGVAAVPLVAEPPMYLSDPVTDRAGALSSSDVDRAEEAVAELKDDTGMDLFVVFVDEFTDASGNPVDGPQWAEETSDSSGLGHEDFLLAVAVEQRSYALGDAGSVLGTSALQEIQSQDVEPALSGDDWVGAVEGAAEGLARVESQGTGSGSGSGPVMPRPTGPSGSGFSSFGTFFFLPFGLVVISMIIQVVNAVSRSRRDRARGASVPRTVQGQGLPELQSQAAEALIGVDNAIRSAEEELAFAEAQFGSQRTQQFRQVLDRARSSAKEAFALRQQLDEERGRQAQDTTGQRTKLSRILELTGQARRDLDQHTHEFATLRSLQDRAPEFLRELSGRVGETRDRLPTAAQEIAGLEARFPAAAVRTVREHRDQAEDLVESAEGFVGAGDQSLERGDRAAAVAAARAAEESLGQANALLDQISEAGELLENSTGELRERIASLSSDLRDAERLAPKDPVIRDAVNRARTAIEKGNEAQGGGDPLRALAALDKAEHDLDSLLEPMRESEAHMTRMRENYQQRVTRVGARLRSIDQTISSRRGAVSSGARTRISEAMRLFEEARRSESDPQQAMALLTRAEQLGEQALSESDQDMNVWGGQQHWSGGGWGGDGRFGGTRSSGVDPWSVILGGILLGGNNSGYRRHSGGWGGGGSFSSGSRSRGSFGGGSFGGSRGGGGSFSGGRF